MSAIDGVGSAGVDSGKDFPEKPRVSSTAAADAYESHRESGAAPRQTGWMYRDRRIGPFYFSWYASPASQLALVAFVCFLCPGMFNALSGLGGGGQVDATVANNAGIALNATFSVVAFFAGSICNRIGIKLTLSLGGLGYFIYSAAFLSYNHDRNAGFNIFAGALLGVCAGMLWTAQGAIMMSYPEEDRKGRYISWFWMIFNLGGVIGSLIPLGQNIHTKSAGSVSDGTYIAFMVLMFAGAALAWCLVDAKKVQRKDGSRVIVMQHPSWKSEVVGLWQVLRSDTYIILLFPMFFASNWFYTYQFQDVNLAKFNVRTRALNEVLYWMSQIFGAYIFGYALDIKARRTLRAKALLVVLFVVTMAVWGGGYAFQKNYTRADVKAKTFKPMDWSDSGYVGPMFLYMFYGAYDAAWQTSVYWYMGSLTNNERKLANFAGFYKGIQSAGAAIISAVDNQHKPYMNIFASTWGLLAGSLLIAAPVIVMKIRDTVPLEEDIKFSDESIADVAPTAPEIHEK